MTAVAFVQRRVPHYREAFFAGLRDSLGRHGVRLDVIVAGRRFAVGGREVIWQGVVRDTAKHDLVIIEFAPRIVSNLALAARSRLGGPRVAGFGHGRNFASTRKPGPGSLHARLVRSVDWWFAYNDLSRDTIIELGYPPDRVTAVNNTIDTPGLAAAVASHREASTSELRRALGIGGGPVALFCGSLHSRRRLGQVFDAALQLRRKFGDFSLVVLGDGPFQPDVEGFANAHDWVRYHGRVVGSDERGPYFAAADVMLMPKAVGLVLLDSFAAQVPLVTMDAPGHGPEIGYLRHGENGWLAPDDLDAYVEAVTRVLDDEPLRKRLKRGCAAAAARYPLEQMVSRFTEGILRALDRAER